MNGVMIAMGRADISGRVMRYEGTLYVRLRCVDLGPIACGIVWADLMVETSLQANAGAARVESVPADLAEELEAAYQRLISTAGVY